MQGDGFALEPGGIMDMAMWLHATLLVGLWSSLDLVPNYVMLVIGNESGGPHHMEGYHAKGLGITLRKLMVFFLDRRPNWPTPMN